MAAIVTKGPVFIVWSVRVKILTDRCRPDKSFLFRYAVPILHPEFVVTSFVLGISLLAPGTSVIRSTLYIDDHRIITDTILSRFIVNQDVSETFIDYNCCPCR